jgi:hypothetical protein
MLHLFKTPDGGLSIVRPKEDDNEALHVEKALFEASRPYLQHPTLQNEALEKWRMNVHFLAKGQPRTEGRMEYTGPILLSVCQGCSEAEVPTDRTFRDAWDWNTQANLHVDMPKARVIHMDAIRVVRNAELAAKDITFMRAVEAGDTAAQATIGTAKQVLRDIPATFDITTDAGTPELLKAKWPTELPERE